MYSVQIVNPTMNFMKSES